ncbi:MAG: hypothetical protein H6502_00580 [Candidatus Woesearchaeota archaeon]|nr:MAG: hypothetical protein H6502_00580 [Candidatus Woesearchaeota archaeon]
MRTLVAKGKRGIVYREGTIAIKVCNERATTNTLEHEYHMLQELADSGFTPKPITYEGAELAMEFIEGITIEDYIVQEESAKVRHVLQTCLQHCRELDRRQMNKFEMNHPPKHIIIRDHKPIFIDFERVRKTPRPKNVNQFVQYLTSTRIEKLLREKNIIIDKTSITLLAQTYKESYDENVFQELLASVSFIKRS